ncbi:hypothetical protein KR009_003573 [Drosophila setifemur]|nr:hypothetical protein KR009_003573 [Drosophila setifemur]
MKLFLVLFFLAIYVANFTDAQDRCLGRPVFQRCTGGRDSGNNNGRHCIVSAMTEMWFYDSRGRNCHAMRYLGCGGNGNRYCSKNECLRNCRR